MVRDWRFRPASFDGVSFYVDAQEQPGGRRLVVHEYAGAEAHDVEDMGRRAGVLEVTAYFASDTADLDSAALRARLNMAGAGLLILPMFGPRRVRAWDWRPNWSKQALNYVGFQIKFVEEGGANAPVPLGLGAAMLAQSGVGLAAIFASVVTDALVGAPQAGFLRTDVAAALIVATQNVEALRAQLPLASTVSENVRTGMIDLAVTLATPAATDLSAAAAAIATALDRLATEQTAEAGGAYFIALMETALAHYVFLETQWGVDEKAPRVPLALAAWAACEAARLLATASYSNRDAAAAARAKIADLASRIAGEYASLGDAACAAFDQMIGLASAHLSSQIVNLAPVVIVEMGASLPSNVLAWRLYSDPERAAELVARNHVATPCMMPLQFETLAR